MDVNLEPRENLRESLARATRAHHDEIEKVMALDRSDFSVEDYFVYLSKFRNFYRDFESFVEKSPTSAAAFYSGGRRKLGLIDLDLIGLGKVTTATSSEVDFAALYPTDAYLWGAIYVIEGSTLGGQFLTRKFQKNFGESIVDRTHFFNSYGDQVGKCWQETVRAINQLELSDSEIKNAIEGAKRTFVAMGRYFESET